MRQSSGAGVRLPLPAVVAAVVAALVAAFVAGCGRGDAAGSGAFTPELISTAAVPLSESEEVALLADERTACVIDSYEGQVRCVAREGAAVGVFGREGEGPGEFIDPAYLTRGEAGTVGVVDSDMGRFTVFEPSGAWVSDVMLPEVFQPFPSFGPAVSGVSLDYMVMLGRMSGSLMTRYDVDLASGEVVGQEESPPGPWNIGCEQVIHGIPDPAGGWAFVACDGHLIFVGGSGDATVLRAPLYVPELPNEQDVARTEEELLALNRSQGLPRTPAIDEALDRYRTTPKNYYLRAGEQVFDAASRYWIATQRDQHEWSWLDVYEDAAYLGSVRVRDRLRAFDLLGSTLVVLVDRQVGADDRGGIPDRALDWYDIADLPFAR